MSWIARKVAGLDNEDHQQVIKEYFENKHQLIQEQARNEEVRKFWAEYEDEYYNG